MSDLRDPRPSSDDVLPEGEEAAPPGVRAMAIVRWALVVVMAALATVSVLHYAGVLTPHGAATATVQYYCPMHPAVVQDAPGECPICGMTLVPRQSGGAAPEADDAAPAHDAAAPAAATTPHDDGVPGLVSVTLPPERVQLMGIRTATVSRETLGAGLRAVGYVAPNEAGIVQVHTRFSGWIQELRVARTGERVRRGDVLATIYSPALLTTQQEFLNARRYTHPDHDGAAPDDTNAHVQTSLVEGARRRLELFGLAPEDVRTLERSGTPLQAVPVRAPRDGYVVDKAAQQGGYVEPETTLFQIADLSTVWVLAEVYESELARLRVGAEATLSLTAYPSESFSGTVDYVYPTLDAATRTVRVRVVFPNPDLRLRPGMYGDVLLALPATDALVVPRDAVVDTGELTYVFVARDGGRFDPRRVRLGARAGDTVAVEDGLAEGEVVVTGANFLVDSESRLRAAINGMGGGGQSGAAAAPSSCDRDFDRGRFREKYDACRACEIQHRGMGGMEDDCKRAIPLPWR